MKLKITRDELAKKAKDKTKYVSTGDAQHLPDNARLVAEAINKILITQEDIQNVSNRK